MKKLYVLMGLALLRLSALAQCGSNPVPVVDFDLTNACGAEPIYFTDMSTISGGSIVGWEWDFGDGSPINTNMNPSYQYNAVEASYSVKLVVTSDLGCKDSIIKTSYVAPLPNVSWQADVTSGCGILCASFFDMSSISSGIITQWEWNFGDGSPQSAVSYTSHCFTNEGSYDVSLTVTSDLGCVSSSTIPGTIIVNPPAAYTTTYDSLQNEFTILVDSITIANTLNYYWDFGDGTTSHLDTPSHIYTVDSVYYVCMKTYLNLGDSCIYCDSIGKDSFGNIIRDGGFKLNIRNANSALGMLQNVFQESNFVVFPNPTIGRFEMAKVDMPISGIYVYNTFGECI
ncbi:MAG: PKD domain-containing protein [Bacteroidia bacterium]